MVALCHSSHTLFWRLFLLGCIANRTLLLYYLLYITCTCMESKSSSKNDNGIEYYELNRPGSFIWKKHFLQQISSMIYQEKCFEILILISIDIDIKLNNLSNFVSSCFSRFKQTSLESITRQILDTDIMRYYLFPYDCKVFCKYCKHFWVSDLVFKYQFFFRAFYSHSFILLKYKEFYAFSNQLSSPSLPSTSI